VEEIKAEAKAEAKESEKLNETSEAKGSVA